jgi:hypothetical protein
MRARARAENEPRTREREPTTSADHEPRTANKVGDKPVDKLWITFACGKPVENFSVDKAVDNLWTTCGQLFRTNVRRTGVLWITLWKNLWITFWKS